MNEPLASGAAQMIAASFRRQAARREAADPTLAENLGLGLQLLRERGFVAAAPQLALEAAGEVSGQPAEANTEKILACGIVASGPGPRSLVVLDRGLLYFRINWEMECDLAARLAERVLAPTKPHRRKPPPPSELSINQQRAFEEIFRGDLTLVTGGPGTGKTTLVGHVIDRWVEQGGNPDHVLLTAPTGRAAARLAGAVKGRIDAELPAARTLHRALGFSPGRGRFLRDEFSPLTAELVVVDEVSMVDLDLMHALLRALPAGARLVLLGDPNQLASVQPGSVIRDICEGLAGGRGESRVVNLTENFRFGDDSGIARLADAVVAGNPRQARTVVADSGDDLVWHSQLPVADDLLPGWLSDPPDSLDEHWQRLQSRRLLCAHRRGPYGVERLNRQIGAALAPAADGFFAQQLLSVVGNHYESGFYNGDQGFVRLTERGLLAYFEQPDGDIRQISLSRVPTADTAFALTVHRAQGSEFGEVHFVLPDTTSPLLSRELIYTAITRAKNRLHIHGTLEALERGINKVSERGSGLAGRLKDLTRPHSDAPIQQSLF
ncbi:MAG: exodeoxyribonuclease V subunit alpha [Pseudomonadota bacterium]